MSVSLSSKLEGAFASGALELASGANDLSPGLAHYSRAI